MDCSEQPPPLPSDRVVAFKLSFLTPEKKATTAEREIMPDTICGVCSINESKYKCPHCTLRYCSVTCFKAHATSHSDDDAKDGENGINGTRTSNPEPTESTIDADLNSEDSDSDGPDIDPASRRNHPFEAVVRDPRFKPLFSKYPRLSEQLQHIEQITWKPSRFPPINPDEIAQGKVPRHVSPFVKGKWEQEKADRVALKKLYELSREDEGVIEFVTLCNLVLLPESAQTIEEKGVPQSNDSNPFG